MSQIKISLNIWSYILFMLISMALAIAYTAEYVYKIMPCHLCWMTRYTYFTVLLGCLLFFNWQNKWLLLIPLTLSAGASIMHVLVERKVISFFNECSSEFDLSLGVAGYLQQIEQKDLLLCDNTMKIILSFSFADLAMIFSVLCLFMTVWVMKK